MLDYILFKVLSYFQITAIEAESPRAYRFLSHHCSDIEFDMAWPWIKENQSNPQNPNNPEE